MRTWILFALVFVTVVGSSANGLDITREMIAADRRLEMRISYAVAYAPLGKIMEDLAQISHIDLSAETNSDTSGTPLCVRLDRVPVAEALNAIWSTIGSRSGPWAWARDGASGRYSYQLKETARARAYRAQLIAGSQKRFEDQVELMIRLSDLTSEQRAEHILDVANVLHCDDKTAREFLGDDSLYEGMHLISEAWPAAEDRKRMWAGGVFPVPSMRLSDRSRAFLKSELKSSGRQASDDAAGGQPPRVEIRVGSGSTTRQASPSLFIMIDGGGYSFAGVGPLQDSIEREIEQDWKFPGEDRTHSLEARTVGYSQLPAGPGASFATAGMDRPQHRISERLLQLAAGAGISLVAHVPSVQKGEIGIATSVTIKQYLDTMRSDLVMNPMRKWRGDMLLVSYPAWFAYSDGYYPYAFVKRLDDIAKGKSFVLNECLLALSRLTGAQAHQIALDYSHLEPVMAYHPLFKAYAAHPEMLSTGGSLLTPDLIETINATPDAPIFSQIRSNVVAIRLRQLDRAASGDRSLFVVEYLNSGQPQWNRLSCITIPSHQ